MVQALTFFLCLTITMLPALAKAEATSQLSAQAQITADETLMKTCKNNALSALQTCAPMHCEFHDADLETQSIAKLTAKDISPDSEQLAQIRKAALRSFDVKPTKDRKCSYRITNPPQMKQSIACELAPEQAKAISAAGKADGVPATATDEKQGSLVDSMIHILIGNGVCELVPQP